MKKKYLILPNIQRNLQSIRTQIRENHNPLNHTICNSLKQTATISHLDRDLALHLTFQRIRHRLQPIGNHHKTQLKTKIQPSIKTKTTYSSKKKNTKSHLVELHENLNRELRTERPVRDHLI